MNCKKCGNPLEPTDVFCKACGEPVSAPAPTEPMNQGVVNTPEPAVVPPVMPQPVVEPAPAPAPVEPAVNPQMQQLNNIQQSMPAAPAAAPAEPEKKKNPMVIIIIAVLAVAIIAVVAILLGKNKNNGGTVTPVDNGGTNDNPPVVVNSDTYTFDGFDFVIPSNYVAEVVTVSNGSEELQLIDKTNKVVAYVVAFAGNTVNDVIAEADALKTALQNNGVKVVAMNTKTINGSTWLIYDLEELNGSETIQYKRGFASLGRTYVAMTDMINYGSKSEESIFGELTDMFNSATRGGTTSFDAPSGEKDDITNQPKTAAGSYSFNE